MPSRINTDYWGAADTWQWLDPYDRLHIIKISQYCASNPFGYNQEALLNKGKYEDSVCIWGAPADCSIVSNTTVSIWGEGGALGVEVKEPRPRSVVPLSVQASPVSASAIGYYMANVSYINSGMYNHRCSGDVTMQSITGQYNIGTATAHYNFFFNTKRSGATLDTQLGAQATYWDYRGFIYRPNITIRPKINVPMNQSGVFVCNTIDIGFGQNWSDLKTSYNLNDEDIMVCGVSVTAHCGLKLSNSDLDRGILNGWNPLFYASGAMQPSTRAKNLFYTTDTADYGFLSCDYNNVIGFGATASGSNQSRGGSSYTALPSPTAFWNNSTQFQDSKNCDEMFRISRKKQRFSDVDYHWSVGVQYSSASDTTHKAIFTDIFDESFSSVGVDFTYFTMIPYLVIDDDKGYGYKQALQNAIAHEIAFYGFPFCMKSADVDSEVWDSNSEKIQIPLFDGHMITTGEYTTLKKAYAQYLPQSVWHNIFGEQSIYDYDPEYNIPEPEPTSDSDTGDLYNTGARRFFWNSLNVHLMSAANYGQFIQKLNALNMSDPDNETWQLQFKGLNPTDYIVGAYASFVKPPKNTASTIMLGPVDMEQTEYTYKETDTNAGFFSFGTRAINPKYYDFRDYAPYTMIELYLPLCGTVEIDTAYCMGCSLKIDYYYDIYTMSCTACIYRVKEGQELLYKTVNGSIGAQIPMLSGNMGAYQNQIKSIENAMKQNELKVLTSTAVLAAGIVAAPMTSGTSLIAAGTAALSGTAGIASGLQKQAELEYQIEHIQPALSVTGAADPQTDMCTGQLMPKLIIKRAVMLSTYNQAEYAKTIGHACCINDILGYVEGDTESPRSGLVVCSSVDTSGIVQAIGESDYIAPTADEINMIKQALSSGVIL